MIQRILDYTKDLWRGNIQLGGLGRSGSWPRVRDAFIKKYPQCEACGKNEKLIAHHKKPFHLFPELELMESNLVALCEGDIVNCHFLFGHCYLSWKCYNPNIESDINFIKKLRKCSIIGTIDQ